jgi:aspartate/methionine/tyrosine aminotransferase
MRDAQFHRIRRLPYVFNEVNAMKAAARAAGHDIIDFGMGNPDGATPQPIVDKLIEAVRNPRTHRYSTSRGIPGLRRAQAAYYQRRFGVALDPETEIVVTLGSKEGLANLAQAITAPGDVFLAPNPSYPIHPTASSSPARRSATCRWCPRATDGRDRACSRAFGAAADRDRAQLPSTPPGTWSISTSTARS